MLSDDFSPNDAVGRVVRVIRSWLPRRCRRGVRGAALALLLFALAGTSGCNQSEPRQLPFPTFDARAPFEELQKSGGASGEGGDEATSEFERAIAESMEKGDGDAGDEQPTIKRQRVPLARTLVSTIPLEFEEWQWSSEGRVTMITYKRAGQSNPDALIYVEGFSELIRMFPSMEVRRFQQTVDPALVNEMTLPGLSGAPMRQLSRETGVDVGRLAEALTRAASHTMGLGLNYSSSEDTFTGWRWVGHNEHDVEVRLGRTVGAWRTHARADAEVSGVFSQITGTVSDVEDVQRRYEDVLTEQAGRNDTGWPAWMLVGSAVVGRDSGAHIAILCKATPECPVASELAEFLARLEPAGSGATDALREHSSGPELEDFAGAQGLPFAPADEIMSPGDIGKELRKAMAQ